MNAEEFLVAKYLDMEESVKKVEKDNDWLKRTIETKNKQIDRQKQEIADLKFLFAELGKFAKVDDCRLHIYVSTFGKEDFIETMKRLLCIKEEKVEG